MRPHPTDSYSITLRLRLSNRPGVLGLLTSAIGAAGGSIGAIDIVEAGFDSLVRDITIAAGNDKHAQEIVETVKTLPGVTFLHFSDRVFLLHLGGKIEIRSKIPIQTRADLSRAYTPGVARVCMAIHDSQGLGLRQGESVCISAKNRLNTLCEALRGVLEQFAWPLAQETDGYSRAAMAPGLEKDGDH